jgi:osmotically-inducible protein OsmY
MNQPRATRTDDIAINARESVRDSANKVGDTLKETFDSEKMKDELARTGQVVREKTRKAGHAIADATENTRITAAIKSKLVADSGLSAFKIDVDTTDGNVTLSGSVSSPDDIARAMKIALEQDGVHRVVSTLLVKPPTN